MNKDNEQELSKCVFEGLGQVSMCWSETPKGVFQSTEAGTIGDRIMDKARAIVKDELDINNDLARTGIINIKHRLDEGRGCNTYEGYTAEIEKLINELYDKI